MHRPAAALHAPPGRPGTGFRTRSGSAATCSYTALAGRPARSLGRAATAAHRLAAAPPPPATADPRLAAATGARVRGPIASARSRAGRRPAHPAAAQPAAQPGVLLHRVRLTKTAIEKRVTLPFRLAAALVPDLKDGDTVTLVVVEEEEEDEEEEGGAYPASAASPPSSPSSAWPVTLHSGSYKHPTNGHVFTTTSLVGGWPAFAVGMGLAVGDELEFERVEGDCGGEGGENGPAQPFRPPSAATLRVRIRRAEVVRAWPRSGTVKVLPSSVGPRGTLELSPAALEALFPDCGACGAWMDVRVVLADGEEGEGGEACGSGRSWTVRVRRKRAPPGKSSYRYRSGRLSAGWPAFVRQAFRGALVAGQVLELTREGDGRGGPGRAEVRVRVLPRASGLDFRRAEVALAWPRSGTVKVVPSSVGPRGALLPLPRAAFEALFPDCGALMDVRVVLADGEEGESGEACGGGRSWTVTVRRRRAPPGNRPRSGFLSAGWPALVREAFRGALEAGQVLELTREGDGQGGPGRAEVRVRALPGASKLESTTL